MLNKAVCKNCHDMRAEKSSSLELWLWEDTDEERWEGREVEEGRRGSVICPIGRSGMKASKIWIAEPPPEGCPNILEHAVARAKDAK